ncbi:MAG: DUF2723 domain-containing protein [Chloroflexi bacterium]|nr:DUF2723 domain-containing protein [Chloroflexota bacterium]
MAGALVIILSLGLCYGVTIAPDLTWAHFSADGGDFISAAATGGVPHPGGYPLYLLVARPFQRLPFGTLAFRTNLLSAVATVLAALVLYRFLLDELARRGGAGFISIFGALAFGLAPFVWGQALVTEVYALQGLLVMVCLYTWRVEQPWPGEWVRGFVLGLAAANHLTAVLMFPLIFVSYQRQSVAPVRMIVSRCLGILGGLSLYLLLPVRASFNPPINWGNAATLDGFFWLLSGKLYAPYVFGLGWADMLLRLRSFAGLLLEQFGWAGVLLGFYGLFSVPGRLMRAATLWLAGTALIFSVLYGASDSQVYLMPVWLAFAIWMAYGAQDLFELLAGRRRFEFAAGVVLMTVLLMQVPGSLRQVDVSDDFRARDFIEQTLAGVPTDALVFVAGDQQIFPLWYAQFGLGRRTDILIVASGLLPYRWYLESLGHTYAGMHIPTGERLLPGDLIGANPGRVICYISEGKALVCN